MRSSILYTFTDETQRVANNHHKMVAETKAVAATKNAIATRVTAELKTAQNKLNEALRVAKLTQQIADREKIQADAKATEAIRTGK